MGNEIGGSVDKMKLIEFKINGDKRGSLISLEGNKNIPFEIKRIYYIYGANDSLPRGFHAHKKLKQVIIALSGAVTLILENSHGKKVIVLDSPNKGILIDTICWREMHSFTKDCGLLVLASDIYDKDDYINDYLEFKKIIQI